MRVADCMITKPPDLTFEKNLWPYHANIAGLDEAGRGALAGPVAVGAVILPNVPPLPRTLRRVRDSKQLTPLERDQLTPQIKDSALTWAVGFASANEIDELGIVPATRLAALRAIGSLSVFPDYLLTDFRLELPELDVPQTAIVKGDQKCLSIACASILAKTRRDAFMLEIEHQFPNYGLAQHKGYGTTAHRRAIQRLGRTQLHRATFALKKID